MHDAYTDREATFAAVMADWADWDAATRHQRHLAVAADTELRRRHPARNYPPLRSAEPPPSSQARRDGLTLTAGEQIPEPAHMKYRHFDEAKLPVQLPGSFPATM